MDDINEIFALLSGMQNLIREYFSDMANRLKTPMRGLMPARNRSSLKKFCSLKFRNFQMDKSKMTKFELI